MSLIKELWREFLEAAKESPRMYFAPLTGAAQAVYRAALTGKLRSKTRKNKSAFSKARD